MKKRILCFGDSNTWGYIAASGGVRYPEGVRWTSRLAELLGEEYVVIEEGQNGRATVWIDPIENHMAGIAYLEPCLESQAPIDLMILMLGTNDTKPYFAVNEYNIAASAARLADMAQKSAFGREGSPIKVLLVAPILIDNPAPFPGIFDARSEEVSRGFAKTCAAEAERLQCAFLDASQIAQPDPADGIHLSEEGHVKLAQAMYEKVKELIG